MKMFQAPASWPHAYGLPRKLLCMPRGFCLCQSRLEIFANTLHAFPATHLTSRNPAHLGSVRVTSQVAVSLAQLAPTGELKNIFVDKAGLDVLLELLTDRGATASE